MTALVVRGHVSSCRGDLARWLGRGDHPRTVVEVVAGTHLRTELGLADGDEVVLAIGG